ncbi:30S ribosomal protein S6 [Candidatus Microgenomates bacterium]|nr:30S ribosomal protein S6 [Candidatus Microgenomates bacterium]
MKKYELAFVLGEKNTEPKAQEIAREIKNILTERKAEIESDFFWGKKKLAYPIAGNSFGYYFIVVFSADEGVLAKINKDLNLNETVVRHLITRHIEGLEKPWEGEKESDGRDIKEEKEQAPKKKKVIIEKEKELPKKEEKEDIKVKKEEKKGPNASVGASKLDEAIVKDIEEKIEEKESQEKQIKELIEERREPTEEERKAELDKKLAEILGNDIDSL